VGFGAHAVAEERGALPLGLAQAASVISGQHLTYQCYLGRLRRVPVSSLLGWLPGGDYPLPLVSALLLSVQAIEASDPDRLAGQMLRVIAVLSPMGSPGTCSPTSPKGTRRPGKRLSMRLPGGGPGGCCPGR